MRTAGRVLAALAVTGGGLALAVGCSSATDPPDPVLWRQVDAAENEVYGVLTDPTTSVTTAEALFDRLMRSIAHWDGEQEPAEFADDTGTVVFYDFRDAGADASFAVFVASGAGERPSAFQSNRVYTCYRLDVSLVDDAPMSFHRSSDHDAELFSCPPELVSALGDGAQYREPWVFDG